MNDERLRRVYAELVDRELPPDRAECPSPEALLALVERRGSEEERLRILDHVMGCVSCRPELELLRAAGAVRPTRKTFWSRHTALAAGIVLALIGGARWLVPGDPGTAVYREGEGGTAALLEPSGALRERPGRLLWRSVDDALRYQVEILLDGGALLYQATTTDTVLALPAEPELGPGAYMWRVDAVLLGGTRRSLGVASFSIEAP